MTGKPVRLLVVDDNADIHKDFAKVLESSHDKTGQSALTALHRKLFSQTAEPAPETARDSVHWTLDFAWQGEEALEKVKKAVLDKTPYALAFVDVRMPPGWDGITTIEHLWAVDPDLEIVICTAYSDYSWEDIAGRLKQPEGYLILKKPFEIIEIRQLASSLTRKWSLRHQVRQQIAELKILTDSLEKSLSVTRATFDSVMEGLLVVDEAGKPVMRNAMLQTLWQIPDTLLDPHHASELIPFLASKVDDPEFLRDLLQKPLRQGMKNLREWKIGSGKTLEIYTHPWLLHDKVIGNVCSFRDITERKQLEEDLLHQATHDSLTGLPNRILLKDRIHQAIAHAKRFDQLVGVLLFDLDNFKQVNDSMGHDAGDELLKSVSNALQQRIRHGDTLTRLGGDEFVIVLAAQAHKSALIQRAKEFLEAVSVPFRLGTVECIVTASIGISLYPQDGKDPETLLKNADAALYRAKETGRNTYLFYLAEFNSKMLQRMEMTTALRQALEKNQLSINYQPLIESRTDRITGVEAQIRWDLPDHGPVPASEFIPLAEESGIILPIGEWALRTACQQNREWLDQGHALRVAINIPAMFFTQRNFVEKVRTILQETGMPAEYLELEITESLILKNVSEIIQKMSALKQMGVRITIDDFGTGYSSMSYLKYFPFDKVKIDKSFIDGILKSQNEQSLIEALITMTRQFGVRVLAEGIENSAQADFIRQHEGDEMQGFLFSPPLQASGISSLLKEKRGT